MTAMPKPGLIAYRESLRLPTSQLVQKLVDILGRKLTAHIGNVRDVRAIDRWIAGHPLRERRSKVAACAPRRTHAT